MRDIRTALAIVFAGLVLLAACSSDEPTQQVAGDGGNQDGAADSAEGDATCPDDPTAIALVNGVVLTVDATDSQASSVLVEGSRISAVGDSIEVPEGACMIDLDGRTVVPGFIDSHVHFTRDWV